MKKQDESYQYDPNIDWQILGELKLYGQENVGETIYAWLIEILRPLVLHHNLVSTIVKSMQDSGMRALQEKAESKYIQIHLVLFVPNEFETKAGTWGFFRIENNENQVGYKSYPKHEIKLYLYMDD